MVMGMCSSSRQSVDATSARQRRPDSDTDAVIDISPARVKTADQRVPSPKLVAHIKKSSSHIRYKNANDTKFIEQRITPADSRNDSRSTEKTLLSSAGGDSSKLPPLPTPSTSGFGILRRTSLTTLPNVVTAETGGDRRFRSLQQERARTRVIDDGNNHDNSPRPEIIAHHPPTGHEISPRPRTIKKYSDPAPLFFPNDPGMMPTRDDTSIVSDTSSYVVIHRRVRVAWEGRPPATNPGAIQEVSRSKSSASESWSRSGSFSSYQSQSPISSHASAQRPDETIPLAKVPSPVKQPNFIRKKSERLEVSTDDDMIRNISTPD